MTVLEKLSDAFLTVLSWFKTPKLMHPDLENEYVELPPLKEKSKFPETFSELLDNLDHTYEAYAVPAFSQSWLSADERIGLKKLGAYVPTPWEVKYYKNAEEVFVDECKNFPSIMFVTSADDRGRRKSNDYLYPDFLFAIKLDKLPWEMVYEKGTPYKFGFAYYDIKKKKHFWLYAWVVVREDRSISMCKIHTTEKVKITRGAHKGLNYTRFVIKEPELVKDGMKSIDKTKAAMISSFAAMFNWWNKRSDQWHVSVKKNGDRVTFSVPREQTKKYFADRDKSIKTASGTTKKIVHYVEAFDRVVKGKKQRVKAHIRGLDTFLWKGYNCFVKAPEFHSLASVDFDVASEDVADEYFIKNKYIGTSKLGLMLANAEDRNERTRKAT